MTAGSRRDRLGSGPLPHPRGLFDVTRAHRVMGTTNYLAERGMSPGSTDPRSDLYSLGCTLFHLLCGRPPYAQGSGEDRVASLVAHASGKVPEIRCLRPDVPAALVKIIRRLLAKDPTDRYDTARQVADVLAPLAEGHNLRSLVEAYLHPFEGPTGAQVTEVTGPEHAGNAPVPPRVAAAPEPIPVGLRIAAAYLAIAVVVLGGIWCWYNVEHVPKPVPPPVQAVVQRELELPGPQPKTDFLAADSIAIVPARRALKPQTKVELDFGRVKMLYKRGEEIGVTVRADGPGSVTIYQVALAPTDGTPVSSPSAVRAAFRRRRVPAGMSS